MQTHSDLFSLQCQLNEDLLQLLIDVVDTELLKTVLLKDFKTVDVENTNVNVFTCLSHRLVHRLTQSQTDKHSQTDRQTDIHTDRERHHHHHHHHHDGKLARVPLNQ